MNKDNHIKKLAKYLAWAYRGEEAKLLPEDFKAARLLLETEFFNKKGGENCKVNS
jgi:hypothetical protein